MSEQPQVVLNFPGMPPGGLLFRRPRTIVRAAHLGDVRAGLALVAEGVADGLHAAGMLSYEAAPAFDSALEVRDASAFPLLWFGLFDPPEDAGEMEPTDAYSFGDWTPEISEARYEEAFRSIHDAIERGDTYQVNGTFRLRSSFVGDARACYGSLLRAHPAAYAAFVDTGDFSVLSLSPELLFDLDGDLARTKPMKGTISRGRWNEEDLERSRTLASSEKDRAENVMIVDLMRNDFGKIARTGSVDAPRLFDIERLATVWQMTSTVTCELDQPNDFASVLAAVFPAGSITGAPKTMATRIIARTETSPRNIYCGTIGYASPNRLAVFNVAIRTVLIDNAVGAAECGIGGGITAYSDCQSEYAEALSKSLFLSAEPGPISLLETLRLEGGVYFLLDRHMQRLATSAAYFGIDVDPAALRDKLARFAATHPGALLRVRLTVAAGGICEITSAALHDTESRRTVAMASRPIDTSSPLIFNKTTRREVYQQFRAEAPDAAYDVLLWNEKEELTEFTTGNLVVCLSGAHYTSPVACGLLPGTFRAELLAAGAIAERVIRKDELTTCEELWFINSVRKWVPVTLLPSPPQSTARL